MDDVRAKYEALIAGAEQLDALERGWLPPLPDPEQMPTPLAWVKRPCGSRVVHPSGECPTCRQRLLDAIPNPKDDPPGWRSAPPHDHDVGIYAILDPEMGDDGWLGEIIDASKVPGWTSPGHRVNYRRAQPEVGLG